MQESPKQEEVGHAKRIELSISPGTSLGPFRIGTSIWEIISFLRERSSFFPQVELKYSQEDPLGLDFIISLPQNGLNLRCDGSLQRLRCIECYDISKVKLIYQNNDVRPTYPGEFDASESAYSLNYPGLSFTFPIPSRHQELYSSSTELPLEFPDGTTPIANHVYVYNGSQNWRQCSLPNLQKIISENNNSTQGRYGKKGRREVERVIAEPNVGITLIFPLGNTSVGTSDSHSEDSSTTSAASGGTVKVLVRSTTPQDLLSDLGKPSCIFYKEEDKMRIHSVLDEPSSDKGKPDNGDEEDTTSESENVVSGENAVDKGIEAAQPADYFFNYFYLGIDVLFDGSAHVCKKIVLHGNIPGHFDFQRYKRCPFVLRFSSAQMASKSAPEEILVDVDTGMNNDIPGTLNIQALKKRIPWVANNGISSPEDSTKQKPVILTRGSSEQNPFGSSHLTGYNEGIVMEVMKNGCVPTLVLF
ncbi:hypothetical protein NQZ79_g7622 [Umbelopsis isabellina]|nr:hypothetical protein NQZ79_g7622 [Umbelopsis isabellina]